MTPIERAFVNRLRRRAETLTPELVRQELRAYEMIREVLSEQELAAAIRSGQVERLIAELLDDNALDPSLVRLRVRVMQTVIESAEAEAVKGLPSIIKPVAFNRLSTFVVDAARVLSTRVVDGLKAEVRETVMQAATDGFRAGVGPRTVARRVRSVIGLAPNQEAAVANFRRMISAGDAEALTRALRDRRFDGTLRKAFAGRGLTAEQVEQMASAYRRRMIAFNAETHARTLALDAQKLAQHLAWRDAIERGVVSRNDLVREWIAVGGPQGDGRNRPEHLDMHGERAGFEEPFSNGELIPGDSTYNCRCVARTILQRMRAAA